MIECNVCHTMNREEEQLCTECLNPLASAGPPPRSLHGNPVDPHVQRESSPPDPHTRSTIQANRADLVAASTDETTSCPKCDADIETTSTTCPYCGTSLAGDGVRPTITATIEFEWGSVAVDGTLRVGRSPSFSPLTKQLLDHPDLSRMHAELWVEDGSVLIRDLGSRNGTRVDGRRIPSDKDRTFKPVPVPDGATILFGTDITAHIRITGDS